MELFPTINLVDAVIDEIALEGLDGITLEALWKRMAMRFHEKLPLSQRLVEQIWNICLQVRELSFYELEKARDELVLYDRYEFVDPDFGLIVEPDNVPDDIYEHCPIDDWKNGIKGSCATYHTRKNISETVKSLNVHEAENNYGRKLIIVASQAIRQNALMDKTVCPNLNMTVMQYCCLERVGRSRYHGEVTQGKLSLGLLKEDPRSLFYFRKYLLRHKLVTKQMHHQKSCGHTSNGSLLHLPRFFVERKPKIIFLAERVIDILKSRENHVAEYSEIKKQLRIEKSIKKLFKMTFFQKVVKTDLMVPWRTLYPHAKAKEWQYKNNSSKEKTLRVVQLIDPDVDINDLWKDEVIEEDEPFELDIAEQQYAVPFLKQVNKIVESSSHDGLSLSDLARKMGLPKLQSRTFFRNLAKSNIVATYMNDMGRQRVTKYVSRKFDSSSRLSKQFKSEMCKMKKLTELPVKDIQNNDGLDLVENSLKSQQSMENKENADENLLTNEKLAESEQTSPKILSKNLDIRDSSSFDAATKILRKYKLTGCQRGYKRTFCNVTDWKDEIVKTKRRRLMQVVKQNVESQSEAKSETDKNMSSNELDEKLLSDAPDTPRKSRNHIVGMKDLAKPDVKNISNVTYRLLKRANIIIEAVKEHKVIDDMTKLMKLISEEEEKEGYDVRIDKKSFIRLLQRLAKDNMLKNIKLTLSTNEKTKCLTFICDPSIDVNHTIIRSAVEQAKIKFCLVGAQPVKTMLQSNTELPELPDENKDDIESIDKLHENDKATKKILPPDLVYDTKAGRRFGYTPKFIRMQTLHAYLFYIIYEHPGNPQESQEKLIQFLRSKGVKIDEDLEKEMSGIFNTEVGWKMFVPPLSEHNGWPTGWALMCDLLLRMPLSIFLKVHKVSYTLPELEDYTNHPVRKHLLVKDIPAPIRNVLLIHRKYIFSIHETITRLCYIGLVQFGPQKLKEKDQVFVYLNRNTELLDTRSSAPHYHKIEKKIYPSIKCTFTSLQTVDKYWYRLWTICVNTRLGGRLVVQGKDIVLEDLTKKNEMIEATEPRSPEESPIFDNGHVPGDRLGAAGIDSAFFAHLKRNWNWKSENYPFQRLTSHFERGKTCLEGERYNYMSKVKPKPVKFTEFHGLKKVNGPVIVDVTDLKKLQCKNPPESNINNEKIALKPKLNRKSSTRTSGQSSYVRRVLPRRQHTRARVKYDDIDYSALQHMDKLRVDWDTREDNILLVCKVAMMYLCPNPRRQIIGFSSVRDVLRSYSLTSFNKTSRACQRRLLYIMKRPETHHSVTLGVEELKQNFYINRRYHDIVDKLKRQYRNSHKYDEQVTMVFRDLVAHIAKKHYDISDLRTTTQNYRPKTVEEFRFFHRIKYPTRPSSIDSYHDETTNDIHSSTINSVIHSSMCCVKDRRSWAYQLFRIYQQYPEWLLRSAMAKIRTDQMVSIKKNYVFAMRKQSNACMPMSSSQYQLSSGYIQKFNTKVPFSVFKEAWEFFRKLARHYNDNYIGGETGNEEKTVGIETSPVNDHNLETGNGKTVGIDTAPVNFLGMKIGNEEKTVKIETAPVNFLGVENGNEEKTVGIETAPVNYEGVETGNEEKTVGIETAPINGGTIAAVHDYINVDRLDFDVEIPRHIIMLDPIGQKDDERYIKIARRYQDILRNLEHVNIDDILEGDNENRKNVSPFTPTKNVEIIKSEKVISEKASSKDFCKTKDSGNERETRKISVIGKIHDNEGNYDTEAFESEQEMNFDDDEDFGDDVDDNDDNDDLICLLDGTKIRLTNEDILKSGFKINVEDDARASIMEIDKIEDNRILDGAKKKSGNDDIVKLENGASTMEIEVSGRKGNSYVLEEAPSGDIRVNDLIERANCLRDERSSYHRLGDSNDIQKRYTRIALLQMREELNDLTSNDSHHAHEYFVLNMFKIFHSFQREKIARPLELSTIHNIQLPIELLPIARNAYAPLTNDLREFAIFPKTTTSYEKFRNDLKKSDAFKRGMDAIYEFVEERREVGASLLQFSTKFYSILGNELYEILSILKENRLVLRSGVKNTRYIHQKYADPWLIHSYKIMRLQQECQQNIPAGCLYVIDNNEINEANKSTESDKIDDSLEVNDNEEGSKCIGALDSARIQENNNAENNETNEIKKTHEPMDIADKSDDEKFAETSETEECHEFIDITEENLNDDDKKDTTFPNDSEAAQSSQRKMQKSRTCLLQTKDIYRAAKQLDLDTAEEIRVVVRPWIRIDGALNRRVLDRMLGGVLAYALVHPGVYLTKIQEKFAPAIQPFHTKELIEILMRLECLKMGVARKPRVTLFSKSSSTRPVFSCIPEGPEWSDDELIVEPMLEATLKFSLFLSNRTYTSDFLA